MMSMNMDPRCVRVLSILAIINFFAPSSATSTLARDWQRGEQQPVSKSSKEKGDHEPFTLKLSPTDESPAQSVPPTLLPAVDNSEQSNFAGSEIAKDDASNNSSSGGANRGHEAAGTRSPKSLWDLTGTWREKFANFFTVKTHNQNQHDRNDVQENQEAQKQNERDARFLNLFTVVRFNNSECRSEAGDNGTCYTANECVRKGGAIGGPCAGSFGVCCLFQRTCGENTTANNTYFVNRNYPRSVNAPGSCQLVVYKSSPDVCQLRLDFLQFKIGGPSIQTTTFGQCLEDQFLVTSNAGTYAPVICGDNSGQHMYVDVSDTAEAAVLNVITNGAQQTTNRQWKIKVTQYKCRDHGVANAGCLQWFMGVTGRIESFNYANARGRQLANQDYSMCIRPEAGFCGIRYSQCADSVSRITRSFTLTGNAGPADENAANQPARVSEVSEFCATGPDKDWLTIPCGTNRPRYEIETNTPGAFCPDRFCGTVMNPVAGSNFAAQVYSSRKPFVLYYHTDAREEGSIGNTGFCLNYIQQPCAVTGSG